MVKIAVISDIHFGYFSRTESFSVPGEQRQDNTTAEYSLENGLIKLLKKHRPDYLFIAGDLTSIASPQEFIFCEKKILQIADEIGIEHSRILCCMGNHDVDWNIANLWNPKSTISDESIQFRKDKYQHIASSVSSFCLSEIDEYSKSHGPLPYSGVYEADDFIVISLNTGWLCGPNQEYSHGKLSADQLKWFENTLKKYATDERKRIVLMHHHPFNYPYPTVGEDISQIAEGAEFVEIAEANKVDLVIHGHRHHPKVKTEMCGVGYPVTYLCSGSLSVNAKHRSNGEIPNTIHFLEVDKQRDYFVLFNYSYTDAEGWHVMKYSKSTPMDGIMKVGKVFNRSVCESAIRKYCERDEKFIELIWDDLEECLQFMTYEELLEMIKEQLAGTYKIFGSFPSTVALLKEK